MKVFNINKPQLSFGLTTPDLPQEIKKRPPQVQVVQEKTGSLKTPSVLPQTGMIKDPLRDAARRALPPGKRISKSGKVYWETRRNRSDALRSNL